MHGQTVRLFLVEGTATGILTAEIMNWTGHLLASPRSKLAEAINRDEAKRTGVYLLVGDDPEKAGKTRLYVGEGDNVSDRIKSHAKDPGKDFWTKVFVITSKDTNLTKSHVRYLENRIVQIAKNVGRVTVANGNEPSAKQLPESDVADMEYFLRQVQLVLPVVGVDALRPKPAIHPTEPSFHDDENDELELVLVSAKHEVSATAIEKDGEITVLEGSKATQKSGFSMNQYSGLRDDLIADGSLEPSEDENCLIFRENVVFQSPSAAAAVIFNRNSNGRTSWKLKSNGQTLKEWQDAQLDKSF